MSSIHEKLRKDEEEHQGRKQRTYLIKLVRDRVSKYFKPADRFEFKPMPVQDHVAALRQKLIEEAAEYVIDPCVNEMADILEVLMGLAEHDLVIDWGNVILAQIAKREDRGGFNDAIGMYQVQDS